MEIFQGRNESSNTWLSAFWFILLGVVIAGAMIIATQPSGAANEEPVVATHSHGVLSVTIPYHAGHSGAGRLTVEVLDPEDQVLAHEDHSVEISQGNGRWQQEIKLQKPLAYEDLVWQRLHYRFEYSDTKHEGLEGTESIAQIVRTPVVHVLGQQSYLSGGQAAVRVIV